MDRVMTNVAVGTFVSAAAAGCAFACAWALGLMWLCDRVEARRG